MHVRQDASYVIAHCFSILFHTFFISCELIFGERIGESELIIYMVNYEYLIMYFQAKSDNHPLILKFFQYCGSSNLFEDEYTRADE